MIGERLHDRCCIEAELASFRDHDDLVALCVALGKCARECPAERSLAGLATVGERGVEHVDAACETVGDRPAVQQIVDAAGYSAPQPERQRRQ